MTSAPRELAGEAGIPPAGGMPSEQKGSTYVVLDFTRRTKGARRERLGLAGELVKALRPHFGEVTVVYPRDEAPPPKCQAAKVVGAHSRSDVFYEEVILPFLLTRWRATHLFTFRETVALPRGVYGHLHLHEDPYPRKSLERQSRSKRSVKVSIAEWRNAHRYPSLLNRIGSLTTSSEWTLEQLRVGPMGSLRAIQHASVAYLGGFEDAESRTIPGPSRPDRTC